MIDPAYTAREVVSFCSTAIGASFSRPLDVSVTITSSPNKAAISSSDLPV